jgi:hypothetical protein
MADVFINSYTSILLSLKLSFDQGNNNLAILINGYAEQSMIQQQGDNKRTFNKCILKVWT